jgi:hypothetical protein
MLQGMKLQGLVKETGEEDKSKIGLKLITKIESDESVSGLFK